MVSIGDIPKSEQHNRAHKLLRECLKPLKISYPAELSCGEYGKPYLAEHPEVKFNLSHSDGIAACIVSDHECGIDCEKVRNFHPKAMQRAFSDAERELVNSAPEEERDLLFFRIWTLKEAYIKAIGRGLSFPMDRVEFSFDGDRVISNVPDFRFRQYVIHGEFVVSICEQIVNNQPQT